MGGVLIQGQGRPDTCRVRAGRGLIPRLVMHGQHGHISMRVGPKWSSQWVCFISLVQGPRGGTGLKPTAANLGDVMELKEHIYRLESDAISLQCAVDDKTARMRQKDSEIDRLQERLEMAEACGEMMGNGKSAAGSMEPRLKAELAEMEKQLQQNEDALMRATLSSEEAMLLSGRQKRRIEELEDAILVLQEQNKSKAAAGRTLDGKAAAKASVAKPAETDLERVIEGLNEVVSTLQVENEAMKRRTSQLAKESKEAKKRAVDMEEELSEAKSKVKQVRQ